MAYGFEEKNINRLLQMKYGIIGESRLMQEAMQRVIQSAPTDLTVLITGETGTGKEVFANAIHGLSERKKFPFVSVNCGAIPETLLESELFGHEKGAFTGAVEQRKGFFEVAHRGTIFLDEIGEMPVATQVKLLRVLESGEFSRLGSSTIHKVDVRVLAATNRDLELEVRDGKFRQDLFFRLNSVHILLPALRRHPEDIHLFIDFFGSRVCQKLGLTYSGISNDALEILKGLPWPGNVRELKNMIETMITLEKIGYISPEILTKYIPAALPPHDDSPLPFEQSLVRIPHKDYSEQFELGLIFRTLLELKTDITDIKSYLYRMNEKLESILANQALQDPIRPTIIEDTTEQLSFTNLSIEEIEKQLITKALEKHGGKRRSAAEELGISERTLYRKISDYGL